MNSLWRRSGGSFNDDALVIKRETLHGDLVRDVDNRVIAQWPRPANGVRHDDLLLLIEKMECEIPLHLDVSATAPVVKFRIADQTAMQGERRTIEIDSIRSSEAGDIVSVAGKTKPEVGVWVV